MADDYIAMKMLSRFKEIKKAHPDKLIVDIECMLGLLDVVRKYDIKPPIGIIPEKLFYENRINDITEAIKRYRETNKNIPDEWFKEVLHLMDRQ